jgi:hypothetical protein
MEATPPLPAAEEAALIASMANHSSTTSIRRLSFFLGVRLVLGEGVVTSRSSAAGGVGLLSDVRHPMMKLLHGGEKEEQQLCAAGIHGTMHIEEMDKGRGMSDLGQRGADLKSAARCSPMTHIADHVGVRDRKLHPLEALDVGTGRPWTKARAALGAARAAADRYAAKKNF